MKLEDKELLLKDLCARLPYGVKVHDTKNSVNVPYMNLCHVNGIIKEAFISSGVICRTALIEDIKPYLFPMSSMTEEQKEEFNTRSLELQLKVIDDEIMYEKATEFEVDFYNKHHLDWRGLIPKGLAIDATDKNIY